MVPLIASQASRFQHDLAKLRDDLAASIEQTPAVAPAPQTPPQQTDAEAPAEVKKSALGWHEFVSGWREFKSTADTQTRSERLSALRKRLQGTYIGTTLDWAIEYTDSDEFKQLLVNTAKRVAAGGWEVVNFALSVVLGLTGLIIVLLYLVFLLLDFPEYSRNWKAFLPPKYRDAIVEFLEQFDDAMRRYFRGQAAVAIITGALFVVGFTIMGMPMAVPLGMFLGLLNMVPYLQAVGLIPASLLAGLRALEGDSSFAMSLGLVVLVFVIVQIIQDSIITPHVMGEATGLRPVAILLGVFVWGKLLGFLGLVLAIPLTCLGIAYYRRYVLLNQPERAGGPSG
jgi:predicted PurR-regulated permease PerM